MVFVKAEGFEPSTACLEGRCSIQLSYASDSLARLSEPSRLEIGMLYPAELCLHLSFKTQMAKVLLSGWQDSNLRPPAPKAGAITELRYTPRQFSIYKF